MAPPSVRPIMIEKRGTGATSVSFKKPNCRSQISSMPEKTRREEDRHGDDAGRQELDVIALAGLLEDRAETEAERDQEQQRLAERPDDARRASGRSVSTAGARECRWRSSSISPHIRPMSRIGRLVGLFFADRVAGQGQKRLLQGLRPVCCFEFGRRALGDDLAVIDDGDALRPRGRPLPCSAW